MRQSLLLLLLLASGCGFTFERSSLVLDRRVAGISAEPPELIAGPSMPSSVQLRALIVEPGAPSDPVDFEWRICLPAELAQSPVELPFPAADPVTGRCPEEDPRALIASGSASPEAIEATVPVPPQLGMLLAAAASAGTAVSLWVTAELKIESERGELFAMKRIVLSPEIPVGRKPNQNPRFVGLLFNGAPWEPGQPLELRRGECQESKKVEVVEDGRTVKVCEHRIDPVFDEAEAEAFQVQALRRFFDESERILDLREVLEFRWFVDSGQLSRQATQMPETVSLAEYDPLSTRWREPSGTLPAESFLWLVGRDGRGGTTWERRSVRWVP